MVTGKLVAHQAYHMRIALSLHRRSAFGTSPLLARVFRPAMQAGICCRYAPKRDASMDLMKRRKALTASKMKRASA